MSDDERLSLFIWLLYYTETEKYDRSLPGNWFRANEWFPDPEQMHYSRSHARMMLDWANDARRCFELDEDVFDVARAYVSRLSYPGQQELLWCMRGYE